MAMLPANSDNLLEIARLIRADEIKTLRVSSRKSGKSKGELWIDYTTKQPAADEHKRRIPRQKIAETIENAAKLIISGKKLFFEIHKASAILDRYNVRLEVLDV